MIPQILEIKDSIIRNLKIVITCLLAGFLTGVLLMGYLRRPQPIPAPKPDQARPSEALPGGKTLVEVRSPIAALPKIPGLRQGEESIRQISLGVRPTPFLAPDPMVSGGSISVQPADIKVFLDLVRLPDGHIRVVAYAEGGKLIESIDVPVAYAPITAPVPTKAPREYRWAALAERIVPINSNLSPVWGAQVFHYRGPLIIGVGGNRYEARASFGVRW